jgi:ABC-type Fe3+/spermidine/putrescine transport system ATPase subunit
MGIELRGVTKHYGDFSLSLDLEVADGETLALVGPSGCGKTTALGLIAGLIEPDGGEILINGKVINAVPPWKRNIAVVFQDLALFPHLSVGKNIAYGPFIRGTAKQERRRLVEETLRAVHLEGYEKRPVHTLSGGEKQRAAIARALAVAPAALLMDEPFSSLDAPLRRALRLEFLEIRRRAASAGTAAGPVGGGARKPCPCVFVTHDREEAAVIAGRIALMKAGRIVETGPARELFLAPKTAYGARFFGSGTVLPCNLFIPKDAVTFEEPGAPAPRDKDRAFKIRAVLKNSIFEGGRINAEFEIAIPGKAEKVILFTEITPRAILPETGSEIILYLEKRRGFGLVKA